MCYLEREVDCGKYRGITLLSVQGKVLAIVMLNSIHSHLLSYQRLEQSGFKLKQYTIDRILALRVLTESKCEYQQNFCATFVDLKKCLTQLIELPCETSQGFVGSPHWTSSLACTLVL